jgi:hypothetical protein
VTSCKRLDSQCRKCQLTRCHPLRSLVDVLKPVADTSRDCSYVGGSTTT